MNVDDDDAFLDEILMKDEVARKKDSELFREKNN